MCTQANVASGRQTRVLISSNICSLLVFVIDVFVSKLACA
jgi:hypothetical protein